MTVGDIMTRNIATVHEEDNLELLAKGMREVRIRHLPVVDDGKLVGLITQRDLFLAAASRFEPLAAARTSNIEQMTFVADLMTRDPMSVRPETPVAEAARLMDSHKIGCLPVTEADGTLVGIVTEADMVRLVILLV